MNPSTSQQALEQLQNYRTGMRSQGDILHDQNQQLGVNAAQQQVTGLRGAINNTTKMLQRVAPSIMGRTAHSLVNAAQATGQIANAQRPIADQLSQQSTAFSNANDEYNRLASRAVESANSIYGGQQDQMSYLQSLYNSLYGREQDAEARRQWEVERQDRLNAENEAKKQAAAQQAALAKYLSPQGTLGTNTGTSSLSTADTDAAYLGRLQEDYKDNPRGMAQILQSLAQSSNPLSQRRYKLAQQLGLLPTNPKTVSPNGKVVTYSNATGF